MHAVTPKVLDEIADAINLKSEAIAEAAKTGRDRTFRNFRTSEIIEITGLTDRQIRDWRRINKATLTSFREAAGGEMAGLPHLPLTLGEMHRMMGDLDVLPRRPAGSRALRLGCLNFKGGSTKSSTCLNLAVYFAIQGWRVLCIDADPQGSLSSMFNFRPEDVESEYTLLPALKSVASQELFDRATLLPQRTHIHGLDLVPANLELIGADFDITAAFQSRAPSAQNFYECVGNAISSVEDEYDLVFIDGAPAFSFAALATMWAVDGMIIPVPPASPDFKATASFCSMAADGLGRLALRAGRPDREWAPCLFLHNRVNAQRSSASQISTWSKEIFGRYRIDESIPDSSAVANALAKQMSVWEATSSSVDARALKVARDAYTKVGVRVTEAILDAWNAGFAAEGE
ncbi:MAG: AAA family ATPase [Rhodanobacter sp.]